MENLFFYPKLTDDMKDECGLSIEKYQFSFEYQNNCYELKQRGTSTIKIEDPMEIWNR